MAIYDDWTIDYVNKKISHVSGSTVYSVNALYSWIQDTFDELGQLDDTVPMKANTPTEYELINSWTFNNDTNDIRYLNGGSIVVNKVGGNDVWSNFYTLGSIEANTQLYIIQNNALLTSYWPTGHVDILTRTISGGTAIDSSNITIFARELSDNYDNFQIQAPNTGGRNAVPIATSNDLNNQTAAATISAYGLTITFGSISRNLNNGAGLQPYDVEINCNGKLLSEAYEYLKYVTRRGSSTVLNGVLGDRYLAAQPGYTPVKTAPFGTFAGGKFFGARGVWITNYDASDAKNFQLTDANNATQTPPNLVAVTVTGVVSGDRVAVFRTNGTGSGVVKNQYVLKSSTVGTSAIFVNNIISSDTPQSGTIRVSGDDRYVYSAWTAATSSFTLTTALPRTYTAGISAFVPLIDDVATTTSISNTLIQSTTIPVIVRVRKKGILPFEIESTVTATGMTVSAIRTVDTIVT